MTFRSWVLLFEGKKRVVVRSRGADSVELKRCPQLAWKPPQQTLLEQPMAPGYFQRASLQAVHLDRKKHHRSGQIEESSQSDWREDRSVSREEQSTQRAVGNVLRLGLIGASVFAVRDLKVAILRVRPDALDRLRGVSDGAAIL